MDIKSLLEKKTFNEELKKDKLLNWQDYAINVCKDFNISEEYRQLIFRYAKRNLSYLQGKVENCKEKFGNKLDNKGHYLISLFRKHFK